ncbi:MAG: hypothetical protein HY237_02685 [Acidobacteria bacterium]|nr:hypothetical protein [Acidobacteriota bacterium]
MVNLSIQRVSPGRLEAAYRKELDRLIEARAIEKIWSKQPDLWSSDAEHARVISNRLGWIGVLDAMRRETSDLAAFAREIREAGLRDIVLLGMGGSSLAPEVFSLTFPAPADGRRFFSTCAGRCSSWPASPARRWRPSRSTSASFIT